ncbi:integrase core domain-containing protein, partial [Micrococcus luteus]|uniref:integrase core domain-containing protein n=1 Tax=Micrococcus luteus TaxID=1270 RepID=UPI0036A0D914
VRHDLTSLPARDRGQQDDSHNDWTYETGSAQTECITTTIFHNGPYKTIADVEYATAGWVEWYNNRRLHSSLAMTTPAEYETAYYAALNRELAPT